MAGAVPADRAVLSRSPAMAGRRLGWSGCCASTSCSNGSTCRTRRSKRRCTIRRRCGAFVGIDLGREPVPDETTMCRFRHLLEAHDLGRRLFEEVQRHLAEKGLKIATGTIVDATIISAPVLDQERRQGARSRDASDQEGQPVVLRHEGAYRRRQPDQADPRGGGDAGQCRRQQGAARAAARPRDPGVGRSGVSRPARGDPPQAPRGRGTSPTAAIAIAASSTRSSGPRTAPNRRCAPRSSIRSGSSSGCSASPRCATAGSRRTLHRLLVTCALANLFTARRHLLRVAAA